MCQLGALFVPGLVMDSPDGAKLIHGEVVQTPEGPRLLPPDVKGDGKLEFCVQGFDINIEEARLLLGKSKSSSDVVSDLLGGVGGAVVAPEALKALAEGFDVVKAGNLIPTMGAGPDDADKVLEDELLDAYDSPAARRIIKASFLAVISDLCADLEELSEGGAAEAFIQGKLKEKLESLLIRGNKKLNPALEALRKHLEEKQPGATETEDMMNLIAGIITCSVPGALKECCPDHSCLEETAFRAILLGCVEDTVRGLLEEDGVVSKNVVADMKELLDIARELEPGENGSFFAKVAAVSEGRCNNKLMDALLDKLSSGATLQALGGEKAVMEKLVNMMGSKLPLQEAFKDMAEKNPNFLQDVLKNLSEEDRESSNMNAADLLHNAVVRTVEDGCQRQLDGLISQLEREEGGRGELTDEDVVSMLRQAIGLARFMGRAHVVEALEEMLRDPAAVGAIREDAVTRGVLRKILVMRRLAGRDSKKRRKLEKLEKYSNRRYNDDEDDDSLKRFVDQSDALTRGPVGGRLKKSKSMIKKSKSMIMTAKDISMNAFMAIKNTASEKDERWLQNFLSESVVEDIPWECSKALIILKEGFQAIIPREASRYNDVAKKAKKSLIVCNFELYQEHPFGRRQLHSNRRQRSGVLPDGEGQAEQGDEEERRKGIIASCSCSSCSEAATTRHCKHWESEERGQASPSSAKHVFGDRGCTRRVPKRGGDQVAERRPGV